MSHLTWTVPPEIRSVLMTISEEEGHKSIDETIEGLVRRAISLRTSRQFGRHAYEEPQLTQEELGRERWAPFPLEGVSHYQVSDLGRVRSLRTGRFTKLSCQTNGYRQVPIVDDLGKKRFPVVHRLVAGAFLPARPDADQVNHRNGNKADNRLSNLEWVTAEENSQHAVSEGLRRWRGSHHRAKITDADVVALRALRPFEISAAARRLGISVTQAKRIWNKKSWTHIT